MPISTPAPAGPVLPGQRLAHAVSGVVHAADGRSWLLPATAFVVLAVMLTWQAGRARLHRWQHQRLTTHAQQVLINPPPEVDPAGAGLWWANLAGILRPSPWRRLVYGTPHIGLEYRWSGRQLRIAVWLPGTVPAGPVVDAVHAAWPGASAVIEDATPPLPVAVPGSSRALRPPAASGLPSRIVREAGGALVPLLPAWYPSAGLADHGVDPLRALIAAGSGLHGAEAACVQILARPAKPRAVAKARAGAVALKAGRPAGSALSPERLLGTIVGGLLDAVTPGSSSRGTGTRGTSTTAAGRGTGDPLRERDARPGLEKVSGQLWEIAIRYAVTHTSTRAPATPGTPGQAQSPRARGGQVDGVARRLTTVAHGLASAMAVHDGRNRFRRMKLPHPSRVLAGRAMRSGFLLSADELVPLAGLPADLAVPGLDRARAKSVPAPIAVPGGGRGMKTLGRAQVGGHSVALPVPDSRQHLHVLGATGVGKSTLMANLFLQDVRARRAAVLIDPKGDLALDVLALLPDDALDRLILIDPDQPSGSAFFNPLQIRGRGDGADPDVIVDHLVSIFASIFQRHWGPRIDDVLRVACLTLMRHRDPQLGNVPPLLTSKQFRAPFTVGLDDPEGLLGFWQWYESTPPALRAQVIGPVLARLRSFLLRDFIKHTVGRPASSFDMTRVLNGGGILIARLPKGQLGDDAARLLGSLLLASVWQAATARARQPEVRRRDAVVYVDEAHNVLNLAGSVADILAEARGYRLSMVLAHQDLAQFPRDTQLAISANARNKVFFNCSPEDARQLARHTLPELDEHDLAHLDAYTVAARLMVGNRETAAFTLTTNPPPTSPDERLDRLAHVREIVARTGPSDETGPGNRTDMAEGVHNAGADRSAQERRTPDETTRRDDGHGTGPAPRHDQPDHAPSPGTQTQPGQHRR